MSACHEAVRNTEEHLMNAWPALRTMMCDGWVFREAGGYTKRANSACALDGRGSARTLDEAERFYARLGFPTTFRLTPLAAPDTDSILADRGYHIVDDTIVMTAVLEGKGDIEAALSISPKCDPEWEAGYAMAHGLGLVERRAHRAILDRIAPLKTGFATFYDGGRSVAFGLGVVERDRLGLFDIVTVTDARRRGLARTLVSGLMAWGAREDAKIAWLSVIADNEKATPLYAQLGFRELYRYHYRMGVQQDG